MIKNISFLLRLFLSINLLSGCTSIYLTNTTVPNNNSSEPSREIVFGVDIPFKEHDTLSFLYGFAFDNGKPDTITLPDDGSRLDMIDLFFIPKYHPFGVQRRFSPFIGAGVGFVNLSVETPKDPPVICNPDPKFVCDTTNSSSKLNRFYSIAAAGIAFNPSDSVRFSVEYWRDFEKGSDSFLSTKKVLFGIHLPY